MTFIFLNLSAEEVAIPKLSVTPTAKNITFSKLLAFDHVYIAFFEQKDGSELQIKHDPSCPCRKLKEEHLAQIINELLKLQRTARL